VTGPEFEAQHAALVRAVEEGILTQAEKDSIMNTVASSWAGGIAYLPFDVLEHVQRDPRLRAVRELCSKS